MLVRSGSSHLSEAAVPSSCSDSMWPTAPAVPLPGQVGCGLRLLTLALGIEPRLWSRPLLGCACKEFSGRRSHPWPLGSAFSTVRGSWAVQYADRSSRRSSISVPARRRGVYHQEQRRLLRWASNSVEEPSNQTLNPTAGVTRDADFICSLARRGLTLALEGIPEILVQPLRQQVHALVGCHEPAWGAASKRCLSIK